jgi:SAM-dependent methyltransferase
LHDLATLVLVFAHSRESLILRKGEIVARSTSVISPDDPGYAGQKHYSQRFLKVYDPLVLGFFGRLIWRCPTSRLVEHYNQHMRRRHLDVGPGTGSILKRARRPVGVEITLLDPNPHVLAHAAQQLSDLAPVTLEADARKPIPIEGHFESVGLNYVLHCLPGPMANKAGTIQNLADVLEPDGVLFGATVLGSSDLHTRLSATSLNVNNRRGIFDNLEDSQEGLREILLGAFESVNLEIVGTVAIFSADHPRT